MLAKILRRSCVAGAACLVLFLGLPGTAADATGAAADDVGFVSIFNGTSLDGWEGKPEFWSVQDGVVVGQTTAEKPTKGNTFLIWRQGTVDDFELEFSYRITGGNSGVQYRSRDLGDSVVGGYQGDFESGTKFSGILYEEKGRGILAQRGERVSIAADGAKTIGEPIGTSEELQQRIKPGEWNDVKIVARGPKLQHFINGQLMSETVDEQVGKRAAEGVLALQLHAGPPMKIEFKNIRLKRLKLADGRKKLVLVAGRPSHGPGDHEFRAGCMLAEKCLDAAFETGSKGPQLVTATYTGGWPTDPTAFDNADAIFFFADGGGGHPVLQSNRLAQIDALAKRGVGIACLHYAVEVPKEKGGPEFLNWMGGYFEPHWSVNPHWTLAKTELAEGHPITRGVKPFETNDEWYYHMRFREPTTGATAILSAVPPDATREKPDHSHHGNPTVRAEKGNREVLAWAYERPDGGRGFGCTGAHFHRNWANDDFRTMMLNALVWTAGLEVPTAGVASAVTDEDMKANLDDKQPKPKPAAAAEPAPGTTPPAPAKI
ncbi:MAG: family 16 glycoside hydrolase [Planctomycetia bacterium]